MIGRFADFAKAGLVGINARNVDYVSILNDPAKMRLVDDKVETKRIAEKADVPTPRLIGTVEINARVKRFEELLDGKDSFVVKPANGSQGAGIVVIDGRVGEKWRTSSGKMMSEDAMRSHISDIISGMYSSGSFGDVAMLEEVVVFANTFSHVAPSGVPDIRVIVHHGVPTMAMVRLPTSQSDGKANLHKGGVGVGVDMATGETTLGVHENRACEIHPDTGEAVAGITIPDWDDMLAMSARCYEAAPLGFLGVDLVIDEERGPLLLELNGRPGLSVQLANGHGLRHRLDRIDEVWRDLSSPEERVAFAKDSFGEADER